MTDQLVLQFPAKHVYLKEDFYVSSSNQKAYDFINSWPSWIKRIVNIFGPPGSGKSPPANSSISRPPWCAGQSYCSDTKPAAECPEMSRSGTNSATRPRPFCWRLYFRPTLRSAPCNPQPESTRPGPAQIPVPP